MKKKKEHWYSITFTGGLVTSLYALVPVYTVYVDVLGLVTQTSRITAIGGMVFVSFCAIIARLRNERLFSRSKTFSKENGFTLLELLIVISIIGILSAMIIPIFARSRDSAYFARTKTEMRSFATAIEMYANVYGGYPPDANRDIPPGLEAFLATGGDWPNAPWPGSVYDWDVWAPGDLTYAPQSQVYQLSIRFCPLNQPTMCKFPNEEWAEDFDYYSAVYYCLGGPCRAHSSQPIDHPGYCINC